MKTNLSSLTRLALLTALALLLFTVESALPPPVPIPGVKLGLANVVTVWALYHCSAAQTALVLFARVLLASFFSGAASALLFSLAGGILCLCGSLGFRHLAPHAPMWLTSALGGALHNLGQLAAAVSIARLVLLLMRIDDMMYGRGNPINPFRQGCQSVRMIAFRYT